MNIKKKIVTDEDNQPVAVQIDYKDWLEFEKILGIKSSKKGDLSKFLIFVENERVDKNTALPYIQG